MQSTASRREAFPFPGLDLTGLLSSPWGFLSFFFLGGSSRLFRLSFFVLFSLLTYLPTLPTYLSFQPTPGSTFTPVLFFFFCFFLGFHSTSSSSSSSALQLPTPISHLPSLPSPLSNSLLDAYIDRQPLFGLGACSLPTSLYVTTLPPPPPTTTTTTTTTNKLKAKASFSLLPSLSLCPAIP